MALYAIFFYLTADLSGAFGLDARFVRAAKAVCWLLLLLALLGVFSRFDP